ncbi:MAG: hypothetical protein ACREJN_09005 [Nitrospiraceae bacterium]
MKFLMALMLGIGLMAAPAMAQDVVPGAGSDSDGSDMNMEIFLQKIKADKKLLVASNMDLSEADGKKFWPIYDSYQKELEQINHRLGMTIKGYADAYNAGKGTISDDAAKKLLNEALSVDEAELKLKRTYADKVGKVLPATKTARYIQIENKIRAVIKFELARQIPLVY